MADEWERENMRQVLKFIKLVEEGKFVPEEVIDRLEKKKKKTDEEQAFVDKWKLLSKDRRQKITWLETEMKLANLDMELKQCLTQPDLASKGPIGMKSPNMDRSIEILKELHALEVSPLMLKKQPQVIKSIFNLCNYKCPKGFEVMETKGKNIQLLAKDIICKLEACFQCPDNVLFNEFFNKTVREFQDKIKDLPSEKVSFMTNEELFT